MSTTKDSINKKIEAKMRKIILDLYNSKERQTELGLRPLDTALSELSLLMEEARKDWYKNFEKELEHMEQSYNVLVNNSPTLTPEQKVNYERQKTRILDAAYRASLRESK